MQHKSTITIKTERLFLRRFTLNDADDIYNNYGSDKNVHRYISWIPCDTKEKVQSFLDMHLENYEKDDFYAWAIEFEDQIVGSIGLFNVDNDNESAEIGYSLGSKWWNHGLITEASNAVLDFAFNMVAFHRIYATVHDENISSKRVLEKLEMGYEGKLIDAQKNRDGTFSNLDVYSKISNK